MRILYGLSGDGLGHTMRARVIASHLRSRGHVVHMAACGRSARILRAHGFEVVDIRGILASYDRGRLVRHRTLAEIVGGAPERIAHNARAGIREHLRFRPDVVITDFSSFAAAVAHAFDLPLVSIDHQHVLDRFVHPRSILSPFAADFAFARAAGSAKTPRCERYLVTSFFFPDERADNRTPTALFGPIVRSEATTLEPSSGEHVLVYQTSPGDPRLLATLAAVRSAKFRVYGVRDAQSPADHIELCAFDEEKFLRDLAGARAVISNGGYTAISEALFFGKPVLSVPVIHQPEQELNARWLEALGLGSRARSMTPQAIARFLDREAPAMPQRDRRLRTGNEDAFFAVEMALKEVA
ncbi:MAG: glycosyltransferase family protein [Polyangiaceae bacterium]